MDASFGSVNPPTGGATGPTSLRGDMGNPGGLFPHAQSSTNQAEAFRMIEQARAGVPVAEVKALIADLSLTNAEAARLLGLTTRELAQHMREGRSVLPIEDGAELVLWLRQLCAWGAAIFADKGKFSRWMRRPLPTLKGQSPLSLLDTNMGMQLVWEELGRLAHGVYS